MKRVALGICVAALLVLTGCGEGEKTSDRNINEHHVKLKDGRTVVCLDFQAGYAGGLSCDWERAK